MKRKGRHRKSGKRYPGGQRVSAGPAKQSGKAAADVVEHRRRLLGSPKAKGLALRAAENPLDTAAARGWLDGRLARAGHAYAALYRRAGHSPARVTARLGEAAETTGIDARRILDMTPDEIAAIWAVVERMNSGAKATSDGGVEDTLKLHLVWEALDAATCAELYSVCVLHSWPWWLVQKIAGKTDAELPKKMADRRAMLVGGLRTVADIVSPRKETKPAATRDHPFRSGPTVEETVVYVDDQGQPDPVTTATGREVVVVRKKRA